MVHRSPRQNVDLRSLTYPELEELVLSMGERRFRAEQLFRWLHGQGITRLDQMTNVSRELRARLGQETTLTTLRPLEALGSADGSTKLAFATADGHVVESVLMPEERKVSVCLSTQVGCAMGCAFCATAGLGLVRSLCAGEIVDQLYRIRAWLHQRGDTRRISNVIYMGMGEPLANLGGVRRSLEMLMHPLGANLSSRRITVSTVGLVPGIHRMATWSFQVNLAVSLNATTQATRERLMPTAKKNPIPRLLQALRAFPLEKRRRITFEYVLIADTNDSDEDAARLLRLVAPIPCKLNVIPLNPTDACNLRPPGAERVDAFCSIIRRSGCTVITRNSRGSDIGAACGQLAGRLHEETGPA